MTCKHENAEHMMPGDSSTPDWCVQVYAECEQLRCIDCGAWLSFGPANDDDPNVAIEIRGAELADADYCVSEFTEHEWLGWNQDEKYIVDGALMNVHDDLPEVKRRRWLAGWLAAEIHHHDTDQTFANAAAVIREVRAPFAPGVKL